GDFGQGSLHQPERRGDCRRPKAQVPAHAAHTLRPGPGEDRKLRLRDADAPAGRGGPGRGESRVDPLERANVPATRAKTSRTSNVHVFVEVLQNGTVMARTRRPL